MSLSINNFPNEIFENIILHLDDKELTKCTHVCKQWQENIISSIRHQELVIPRQTIASNLITLSSYNLSSSAIKTFKEDAKSLITKFFNLNTIKDIRSNSLILKKNIDNKAIVQSIKGHVFGSKIKDSFLKDELFDRELEEAGVISENLKGEWDNTYTMIIKYMLKNKFNIKDITEKFKLLSLSAQSSFIHLNDKIIDTNQMHLFIKCMPPSSERDGVLINRFAHLLKEDKIDFETIIFFINATHSNGTKTNILMKAFFHISDKEHIDLNDLNLVTNISGLLDQVQLHEQVAETLTNMIQEIRNRATQHSI